MPGPSRALHVRVSFPRRWVRFGPGPHRRRPRRAGSSPFQGEAPMKRRIVWLALALTLVAGAAYAQPQHPDGGLGFHETDAPLGIRWWLTGQKMALDAGIGFGSDEVGGESLSHFAFDIGLPIMLKNWDRVHFMVRPGLVYRSQEVIND